MFLLQPNLTPLEAGMFAQRAWEPALQEGRPPSLPAAALGTGHRRRMSASFARAACRSGAGSAEFVP